MTTHTGTLIADIEALLDVTLACVCGSTLDTRMCRGCKSIVCPDCRKDHVHAVGGNGETEQFQY